MTPELEQQLRLAVNDLIKQCIDLGYKPIRLRQAINEPGCSIFDLICRMILTPDPQAGLTTLYDLGRLDLSLEALVLSEPWCQHFPDEVLEAARIRLKAYGFPL